LIDADQVSNEQPRFTTEHGRHISERFHKKVILGSLLSQHLARQRCETDAPRLHFGGLTFLIDFIE
jgi:hypothetical protein